MCLSEIGTLLIYTYKMNGISDNDAILPQQHHNSDGSVVTVWDEVADILSALIGGGRYGLKIRVPHAVGKFVPPYVYTKHDAFIS